MCVRQGRKEAGSWKSAEKDILLAACFEWLEAEMEEVALGYYLHNLCLRIGEDLTFNEFKVAIH